MLLISKVILSLLEISLSSQVKMYFIVFMKENDGFCHTTILLTSFLLPNLK